MSNSNRQTAHIWAQQVKESGKSSNGNLNFQGATLYSYSIPIARFVIDAKGKRITLVTSQRYSMTTITKHMPALRLAIDYGRGEFAPCFTVPNLGRSSASISADNHAGNISHFISCYAELVSKAKRARVYYSSARLLDDLEAIASDAIAYAKAFKLKAPKFAPESAYQAIIAHRAEREAKSITPEAIAKRDKASVARAALAERKAALARLKREEKIAAWRLGANVSLNYSEALDSEGGALLRIRGNNLETSLGASVPMTHAIRVFQFAKLCRNNSNECERDTIAWQRNGRSLRVGHFSVDRVLGDGSFRAGCHPINWPEIEATAIAAGVADMAPADTRDPIAA